MRLRKTMLAAVLVASMGSASTLAQAAPAPVQEPARSGAEMTEANELGRGGWFIPLLAILAIIAGILAAVGGGDDRPHSP